MDENRINQLCKDLNIDREDVKVYESSYNLLDQCELFMAKLHGEKMLISYGGGKIFDELDGRIENGYKICPLSHPNRLVINRYLDFTKPRAFGRDVATMGLGDRLGIVTPAHIKTIQDRDIKPILAQQSKRELNLTGRTYRDVLDDVSYAVLQEGYRGGFGADGDHLKDEPDIKYAIEQGYTMITLDCSERLGIDHSSSEEERYGSLPSQIREYYEDYYLQKEFSVGDGTVEFSREGLRENVLLYGEAIEFIQEIYNRYIKNAERDIDFEVSLDETAEPTTIHGHFLVAEELRRRGINITSMAPRFVGEFQKGIDYIGDIHAFEKDLIAHVKIADHFGYKISIHSGSDKFSLFDIIGKHTQRRLHIKTSGTNWLEAIRVIAEKNPDLYRRIHEYAITRFEQAKEFYHVTADLARIKDLAELSDEDLGSLLDLDDSRQLLHITYGFILGIYENNEDLFRKELFDTLHQEEEKLEQNIIRHIGKHLDMLGF